MAIIGSLPFNILNGQLIDAPPVMADLNFIVSQVNANVPALIPAASNTIQYVATVGGTGNAITLTPSISLAAYAAGVSYSFKATADLVAGGATVNVSGLGAKALQTATGAAMTGGEIKSGGLYIVQYTGAAFQLVNGAQGSGLVNWTPTITFGGAGVGITYTKQEGLFFKIGPLCFYSCQVTLSNKGSSTGGIRIEGMPVFSSNPTCNAGVVVGLSNVTFGTQVQLSAGVAVSDNAIEIFTITSGGALADLQDTACSNTSDFLIGGFFTA